LQVRLAALDGRGPLAPRLKAAAHADDPQVNPQPATHT